MENLALLKLFTHKPSTAIFPPEDSIQLTENLAYLSETGGIIGQIPLSKTLHPGMKKCWIKINSENMFCPTINRRHGVG